MSDEGKPGGAPAAAEEVNGRYARYVLGVLCVVYTFNAMDRTILSILAEDVKKTFALSDSMLGFLHGTAFAIFYALFGYPVGRLADRWRRVSLLAAGLSLWSLMTALCGLAPRLGEFIVFRAGLGIGEATASPAGFSLVSDWFSKARRASALGLYVSGLYWGAGLSLLVGGLIASRWAAAFPTHPPFGLEGWKVTFLALGLPGLLLALWTSTLREPARGQSDGVLRPPETHIWSRFAYDLCSVLPPLTLYTAARAGRRTMVANIAAALVAAAAAWLAIQLSGDLLQWITIGFGYYAAFSAAQSLHHKDRPTFALTWGSPTFLLAMVGFGFVSMVNITMGFWTAPLAARTFHVDKATVGLVLGLTTALGGAFGVLIGGRLSDWLLKRTPLGRVWVGVGSSLIPWPFIVGMCLTKDPVVYFALYVPVAAASVAWLPAGAATIQELVLPRMRGTATNIYFLWSTMVGSGLAPYLVGKVSGLTHSLANAMLWSTLVIPSAAVTLLFLGRYLQKAEASKWARAEAAGEPV